MGEQGFVLIIICVLEYDRTGGGIFRHLSTTQALYYSRFLYNRLGPDKIPYGPH